MGKPEDAIVKWAEAHTGSQPPASNEGAEHMDGDDISTVLYWREQGLTQQEIAAKFDPPKNQSTISRCLAKYGHDRRAQAKRIADALTPNLVLDIARSKDPKAKVALLKGRGVLEDQQQQGVVVLVGNGGSVSFTQVLSPPAIEVSSERVENP